MLDFWKDVAIILGGVVAITTFFSGVVEYFRQGRRHRVEHFLQMRRRFLETTLFRDILNLLAADDPLLADVPVQDRRNFGGFLEEVALMVNSGLIRPEVAHYMFGDYALLTDRSVHFWSGLDKQGQYWTLFRQFAHQMGQMQSLPNPKVPVRF